MMREVSIWGVESERKSGGYGNGEGEGEGEGGREIRGRSILEIYEENK
jgi:hypothetical protein